MADLGFPADVDAEFLYQLKLSQWYARRHPKEARLIGLLEGKASDPAIQELIGANALCVAEARRRTRNLWPEFLRHSLASICPLLDIPVPSSAVFQTRPEGPSPRVNLPARTPIWAKVLGSKSPSAGDGWSGVRFVSTAPLEAWAVTTKMASISRDKPAGSIPSQEGTASWLKLELGTTGKHRWAELASVGLDSLRFFLGADSLEHGRELYRSLIGDALAVFARCGDGAWTEISAVPVAEFAAPDELLWPNRSKDDRILAEAGAFPQKRLFVDFLALKPLLEKAVGEGGLEVAVALARVPELPGVTKADFALGCVPALNLFESWTSVNVTAKGSPPVLQFKDDYNHALDTVRVMKVETLPAQIPCDPYYGGKFAYGEPAASFWHLERGFDDPTYAEVVDADGAGVAASRKDHFQLLAPSGRPLDRDLQLRVFSLCSHGDRPCDEMKKLSPSWSAAGGEFALISGPTRAIPIRSRFSAPKWLQTALTSAGLAMEESGDASDDLKVLLSLMPPEYGSIRILDLTIRAIRRPELVDGIPILRRGRQVVISVAGSAAYPFAIALDEDLQRTTDAGTYTATIANVFGTLEDGTPDSNSGWTYELPPAGKAPKKLASEVKK